MYFLSVCDLETDLILEMVGHLIKGDGVGE